MRVIKVRHNITAQQIRNTTYLSEVSNKVDTVIRKSYQKITK